MSDGREPEDALERLVWRFLKSQEDDVDAEAFLARLRARRQRRPVRFTVPVMLAAAAGLLIALGVFVAISRGVRQRPAARVQPLAMQPLEDALREELGAAWGGFSSARAAAVRAGKASLLELAEARPALPDLAGRPSLWLDGALNDAGQNHERSDHPLVPVRKETNHGNGA